MNTSDFSNNHELQPIMLNDGISMTEEERCLEKTSERKTSDI